MLDSRKKSRPTHKRDLHLLGLDSPYGANLTGWGIEDPFDYHSLSMLNRFSPEKHPARHHPQQDTRTKNSIHTHSRTPRTLKTPAKSKQQSFSLSKIKQNVPLEAVPLCKKVRHLTYDVETLRTEEEYLNTSITRKALQPRHDNLVTHRIVSRKEFPKNIYEFVESKRELDKMNRLNKSLERRNATPDCRSGVRMLPKIRPFLQTNKLLKLQSLKCNTQLCRSPRMEKLFVQGNSEQFDDQRIFSSHIQYGEQV